MGAFGKALKGIGTVASIVAAPATGGASLAAGGALQGIGAAAETIGKVADTAGKVGGAASSIFGGGGGPSDQPQFTQAGLLNSLNGMAPTNNVPGDGSSNLLKAFQGMSSSNSTPVNLPVSLPKQEGNLGPEQEDLLKLLQQLGG